MDSDQINTYQNDTGQQKLNTVNLNKKRPFKKILIIALSTIFLVALSFLAWYIFLKDTIFLANYSNSSISIDVPSSRFEIKDNFNTDKTIEWSRSMDDKNKISQIRVVYLEAGDSHDEILKNYDDQLTDANTYAIIEKTDKSNLLGYDYNKSSKDGVDIRRVVYTLQADGKKVYEVRTVYYVKGTVVIALKIKAGIENKKFLEKIDAIENSFKIK
jgi:flagellar basal body-associated protein FliL